jgi:hypothetical protein
VSIGIGTKALSKITFSALGVLAAFVIAAPSAHADPETPAPPPPAVNTVQESAASPAEEVPHLTSPENLPPGTSASPVGRPESRGLAYLQDLWHAMQTQEISMSDALLLLTQRPLYANEAPPPGMPAGPQPPPPPEPLQPAP